ncbi:MAG TPA: C4-dicarboxylate ABC transporter substrate-binding protein, partial [Devosiaceae bacterium]|nr:C4-dicarboxylate ABC transporter substrate-binding protein [Devosiaceae bacterium]
GRIWRQNDDGGLAAMVGAGVTYVEMNADETAAFEAALEPVVDRWVEEVDGQGIDGAGLVEAARAAIASHSMM